MNQTHKMKNLKNVFPFLLCFISITADAQFKRYYARKNNYAIGTKIQKISDTEKLLFNNFNNGSGGDTLQIIKINQAGEPLWAKNVDFKSTIVNGIAKSKGGDFILVGSSNNKLGQITSQPKAMFMRVTPNGEIVDSIRGFGTSSLTSFHSVLSDNDNFYIAGEYADFNNFSARFSYFPIVLKTDVKGKIVWVKRLSLPIAGLSRLYPKIVTTTNGDFIVALSHSYLPSLGQPVVRTLYLMRINQDGNKVWIKSIDISALGQGRLTDLTKMNESENALLLRIEASDLSPLVDFAIIKFNDAGELLAAKKFGDYTNTEEPFALEKMPNGNLIIAGQRVDRSTSVPLEADFFAEISPELNYLRGRTYTLSSYNLYGADLEIDKDSSINYATSYYCQAQKKYFQALVKANHSDLIAGCENKEGTLLLPDSALNLNFKNESLSLISWSLTIAAAAAQTFEVTLFPLDICTDECPVEFTANSISNNTDDVYQLYPNPFESFIELEAAFEAALEVRDIQGKVLMQKNIGKGRSSIDLSNLRPGIYIIYLQNSAGIRAQKLIKNN
jgi:hypothetical protein